MFLRRRYVIAATCLVILLAGIFLPNWKAIGMIMGIGFEQGSFQPLTLFTESPVRERTTIESSGGRQIQIDVYSTDHSRENKRGMIIYTPFIGGGLDDPQIERIADTFARIGFTVAVPSKVIAGPIVSTDDTADVLATIAFLRTSETYHVEDFGFLGLCYGNGPMIAAATNDMVRDHVSFIIAYAPYFDLQNAVSFLKTGTYEYGSIKGSKEPAGYAVTLLDESFAYHKVNGLPLKQIFAHPIFISLREKLSPAAHLADMQFDLYIIHSLDDSFIPYTESLRFADAMKDKGNVHLLLSRIFTHEEFRPLTPLNILRYYIPEGRELYRFYSAFLAEQGL